MMEASFFTHQEMHMRLIRKGHVFCLPSRQGIISTNVCPSENTIITIALEPDATLKLNYRSHYFICTREKAGGLMINVDPFHKALALNELISDQEQGSIDFLLGPVQWLIARLKQFVRILIWPKDVLSQPDKNWISQILKTGSTLCIQSWLQSILADSPDMCALSIDLNDKHELQFFLHLANLVSSNDLDLFVSDYDCSEVYLLHHHDKIIVSIPDLEKRSILLKQLHDQPNLFEDWSGY